MTRILVSACLIGEKVRYDGGDARSGSAVLGQWLADRRVVPFCPEVAGGLGVPRPPAEIAGAGGSSVLDGTGGVVAQGGADVTQAFLSGARLALELAVANGVRLAVLKEGSPSCGSEAVYDGSFGGRRVAGQGVTTALLERHGIRVFSELRLREAAAYLAQLEGDPEPNP